MNLKDSNAARWANMKISADKGNAFKVVADRLSSPVAKSRYITVSARTGVPWEFIAVTHQRESSQNWNTQLAQGDPLSRKSTHVPKGRGPFQSWEEGAYDALVNCAPYAARNKDWSIGGTLEMLEKYNGLGYAAKGVPSPYVWAGTNQYVKGKYVADGKYDPNHVDTQLGCAGLLKFLGWQQTSPSSKATVATTAAVVAGGATYTLWDRILAHPTPYVVAGVVITAVIGLMAYAYRKRNV